MAVLKDTSFDDAIKFKDLVDNDEVYFLDDSADQDAAFVFKNNTTNRFVISPTAVQLYGQTLIGSAASGGNLTLRSTSHTTKGKILFGTSAYDEVNNRLGIGTSSPSATVDIKTASSSVVPLSVGGASGQTANLTSWINNEGTTLLSITPRGRINLSWADITVSLPSAPGAPTVAVNPTDGNLNGTYNYRITFITQDGGETQGGTASANVSPVNQQVDLTNIPTGPAGIVTGRRIYRSTNTGTPPYKLVATINDNTTTSYTDNVADGSLGAVMPYVPKLIGSINTSRLGAISGYAYFLLAPTLTETVSGHEFFFAQIHPYYNPSRSPSNGTVHGMAMDLHYTGTVNHTSTLNGGRFRVVHRVNTTISTARGGTFYIFNGVSGSTGTITTAQAGYFGGEVNTGATITNFYGNYIANPIGAGTLTNNYGLYIENQTKGTTNYAIYSAGGTVYFAGNVGIGTTNPASFKVQVAGAVGPNSNNTYDLGSSALRWATVYANKVDTAGPVIGHMEIDAKTGTSYTLQLSDDGKLLTFNNSSTVTVTVPPNSSVAFPVGTTIALYQLGTGQVVIQGGSGVTVESLYGASATKGQYAMAVLTKRETDTWILSGDVV